MVNEQRRSPNAWPDVNAYASGMRPIVFGLAIGFTLTSVSCSDGGDRGGSAVAPVDGQAEAGVELSPGTDGCSSGGGQEVVVPDVVGLPLGEAIVAVRQAGLHVVETGTPPNDPVGPEAVVQAQEPPAGERAPVGACIGFRTGR